LGSPSWTRRRCRATCCSFCEDEVAVTGNAKIKAGALRELAAKRLAGKKPKVIITACMRKLLVILNAMLRDGTDWRIANA